MGIVYSIFADIDVALFEGTLGENVALQWVEELKNENCEGGYQCKECAALTLWPLVWGAEKVVVLLSKSVLVDGKTSSKQTLLVQDKEDGKGEKDMGRLKGVLGVLVHEMIHVFLTIMTGANVGEGEFEGVAGHGEGFARCLVAVNGTLRKEAVGWEQKLL